MIRIVNVGGRTQDFTTESVHGGGSRHFQKGSWGGSVSGVQGQIPVGGLRSKR